jgi:adenosine deaminase
MLNGSLIDKQLLQTAKTLPKIELHRHLEGAVSLETLIDIAREHTFEMPEYHIETLRPFVQMMPDEERDWKHFLAKFATLRQFYRSPEIIRRITREAVIDAALDNIKYMELRFTPRALSTIIKATPYDVISWVCEAVSETCPHHDIDVRLIASMNRHESLEFGEQVLQAAVDHCDKGVVAIDLAGQEEGHPASAFRELFREAKIAGLGVTIHAGEWDGAMSVWDAIGNVGAERVGHGIRALEDPGVVAILAERGVVLEVCPTSNVDSGAVQSLRTHPLPRLIDDGIITTINTDDPLVSDITLSDELARAMALMNLTVDDIKQSILRAAQAAFLPDAERQQLMTKFHGWLYGN